MRVGIFPFVFLFLLLTSNFAWAASWSEVTVFQGSGDYITDYFTCNHVEWRINWNYTPSLSFPTAAGFAVYVYPKNENVSIASILEMGNTTTSGTSYLHNQQGTFYLKIDVANLENYSVVIEQDLESVPEFSLMILVPLLTAGILVSVILARRQKQ